MRVSSRRVRAIVRKELREYRHNGFIVWTMAIFPLIFLIQPLVVAFVLPASASNELSHGHLLLYMLGIPAIVPAAVAAYAVVGERQQGTLEPVLTTPVRREELVLGKALAALVPSVAIAYAVYAVFLALVGLFAQPAVAAALIAFNVVHATLGLAIGLAAALLLGDGLGWRIMSATFDRERLITGTR